MKNFKLQTINANGEILEEVFVKAGVGEESFLIQQLPVGVTNEVTQKQHHFLFDALKNNPSDINIPHGVQLKVLEIEDSIKEEQNNGYFAEVKPQHLHIGFNAVYLPNHVRYEINLNEDIAQFTATNENTKESARLVFTVGENEKEVANELQKGIDMIK
ncbi:hypothetical protein [Paenibacillus polymyxa]|uniref:hypothetical protein n=1 Tax=Paenibacillus polymyxa TaxID=1406 RepID=UPI002AB51A72|nr:hypothetical protein [Paenibacillus polymyxa]MDY8023366.1 hypothetical protein [Paenibacillus polymyxa]